MANDVKLTISVRMCEMEVELVIEGMPTHGFENNRRPVGKRPIPLPEGRRDLMPRNYLMK